MSIKERGEVLHLNPGADESDQPTLVVVKTKTKSADGDDSVVDVIQKGKRLIHIYIYIGCARPF